MKQGGGMWGRVKQAEDEGREEEEEWRRQDKEGKGRDVSTPTRNYIHLKINDEN